MKNTTLSPMAAKVYEILKAANVPLWDYQILYAIFPKPSYLEDPREYFQHKANVQAVAQKNTTHNLGVIEPTVTRAECYDLQVGRGLSELLKAGLIKEGNNGMGDHYFWI